MDYRTLVYFVLFHCFIDALPYEWDSQECGDFNVHFNDYDKPVILEEEEALTMEKNNENEDTEIFLDELQKQDTLDLEKDIEDTEKKINLDVHKTDDNVDLDKNDEDEAKQKLKTSDLEKNSEDEDKEIFVDVETLGLEKKDSTDKPKSAEYSVTEFVIDIPDDRTKGPIIANYSISKPINIASSTVSTAEIDDKNKSSKDGDTKATSSGNDSNDDGTGKKNYISILHVKAEYDDKKDKTNQNNKETSDFDFVNVPQISGFKEYLNGIKQGIVNGFNSIIHKNKNNDEGHDTHDEANGPFSFFNKFQKKGTDFAQKIHNHIFGDQTEDQS